MEIKEELMGLLTNPFAGLTNNNIPGIQDACGKIAEMLFNNFCIKCDNKTFRLAEIEFYYYKNDESSNNNFNLDWNKETYPRNKDAGEFFFHYSGMDICFQCHFEEKEKNDEFGEFGGILIRSLFDGDRIIAGPLFCANTILNACKNEMPKLVPTDKQECKYNLDLRCGISSDKEQKKDEKLFLCYYVTHVENKKKYWENTSERIAWDKKNGKFKKCIRNYKKERGFKC